MLEAGEWPGNVRELDHVIARAALRAQMRTPPGQPIKIDAIELDPAAAPASASGELRDALPRKVARGHVTLRDAIEELKRDAVAQSLAETGGNWAEAARRLGMDRSNLHHMAQRLGIPIGR